MLFCDANRSILQSAIHPSLLGSLHFYLHFIQSIIHSWFIHSFQIHSFIHSYWRRRASDVCARILFSAPWKTIKSITWLKINKLNRYLCSFRPIQNKQFYPLGQWCRRVAFAEIFVFFADKNGQTAEFVVPRRLLLIAAVRHFPGLRERSSYVHWAGGPRRCPEGAPGQRGDIGRDTVLQRSREGDKRGYRGPVADHAGAGLAGRQTPCG